MVDEESASPQEFENLPEGFAAVNYAAHFHEAASEPSEDTVYVNPDTGDAALYDGMGGSAMGEIYSRDAKDIVKGDMDATPLTTPSNEVADILGNSLQKAHEELMKKGQDGGTTAVACRKVLDADGKKRLAYAYTGDSPLAVIRNEEYIPISEEQDYLWDLNRRGQLPPNVNYEKIRKELDNVKDPTKLSDIAKVFFAHRSIVRGALGQPDRNHIKTGVFELQEGDTILLYSDGLSNNESQVGILVDLTGEGSLKQRIGGLAGRIYSYTADKNNLHDANKNPHERGHDDDLSMIGMVA